MKTEEKESKKILLITTSGCEGCAIASKLIQDAIKISKQDVDFEIKDSSGVSKKWLKTNNVTDYPSTFLMVNNNVKFSFVGTRPAIVISQWIRVHLC